MLAVLLLELLVDGHDFLLAERVLLTLGSLPAEQCSRNRVFLERLTHVLLLLSQLRWAFVVFFHLPVFLLYYQYQNFLLNDARLGLFKGIS